MVVISNKQEFEHFKHDMSKASLILTDCWVIFESIQNYNIVKTNGENPNESFIINDIKTLL